MSFLIKCNEEFSIVNILRETSIGAEFCQSLLFRKFCEFLLVFTQQVSLYFRIRLWKRISNRKFCRYHLWFQILIRGGFPCTSWASGKFFTQICCCSLDAELIDRNNCAKNQFNGFITAVEMNGFHFFSFAFHFSSFQCAAGTKCRMSDFGKVEHHAFSSFWSFSQSGLLTWCPSHFFSDRGPWNDQRPCGNLLAYSATIWWIRNTQLLVSFFSPYNVVTQWHEDDPSFDLLWFTLWFSHHILNLVENS